jgi:hypothetical protein
MLHQTIPDIRIMFCKGRCRGGVFTAKNDQRAVGGLRKRSGQNQFSAVVRGIGKLQMLFAKRSASLHKVIDYIVEKGVVSHFQSPLTRIGPTLALAYHGVGLDEKAAALPVYHCCRNVSSLRDLRALEILLDGGVLLLRGRQLSFCKS